MVPSSFDSIITRCRLTVTACEPDCLHSWNHNLMKLHYAISNEGYCEPMSGCILLVDADRSHMVKDYRMFSYWLWMSLVVSFGSKSLQPVSLSLRGQLAACLCPGKLAGLSSLAITVLAT